MPHLARNTTFRDLMPRAAQNSTAAATRTFKPMRDQIITLSSGRKLGYAEYGDPQGVPMFYFHGWPSSRLQGEILDELGKKRGIRVIAPDRPGIGLSELQPGRTLLDWPRDLSELAKHLGWEQFHAVGVSGGGPYVLACAHALPDRLLSAGVICGAPPLRDVGSRDLMWTYRLALWGQRHVPLLLAPGFMVAGQIMRLPPNSAVIRSFLNKLGQRDQLAMSNLKNFRILMESGRVALRSGTRCLSDDGNIYSSDWGIDLGTVNYPIRYWHGGLDKNIPPGLVGKFVQKIPGAKLRILEEDGHYSLAMLRNEEIVETLLG
ncbi:hypothetical protein AYO49_01430 [Verrucomicrobiaceae bacterium SCGC AG-212-N21]|nr:hypothetical protein AYO49_01430 [Verrucomicrobiaceae bacterium SCGC AG-212-N21]